MFGLPPAPVRVIGVGVGEPPEFELIVRVAARAPLAVGLKLMVTRQFAPLAKEAGQFVVWVKSPALGPEIVNGSVKVSGAVPCTVAWLKISTCCGKA